LLFHENLDMHVLSDVADDGMMIEDALQGSIRLEDKYSTLT
jgi:hypothetical protein